MVIYSDLMVNSGGWFSIVIFLSVALFHIAFSNNFIEQKWNISGKSSMNSNF